ncbi:hypothetical protein [Bosea sp. BK604]|uniref:hypothetical protein n=1 Tax=Bosea sp. BK604 TaxID=2512180 RepID=UPI001045E8E3|nr:hypothetical protein [Bosea sp. BK604]TCR64703.1 hypothetical protein EV560_106169 [Bosea sp. BK604]
MLSARTAAAVGVWATAGVVGTIMFVFGTPRLEAAFAPVLSEQRVEFEPGDRTPGRMCWTWYWVKVRYAQPIVVAWTITVEGTAVEFPVITARESDGEVLRNPETSALGPGRRDLCAAIPTELDQVKGLIIRGQINYRMPHGLWTIWQELPSVRVPPLNEGKP